MGLSAPAPLQAGHVCQGFDCKRPALDDWLLRHALQAQGSGSARTFVICDGPRVIGYYSLSVGQIDTLDAPERVRRGMGQYPIPVMLLARLAVDKAWHGCGLGTGMLQDAIRRTVTVATQAGVRALLTHPLDDAAEAFYRRFGFEPTQVQTRQLVLLLKDARRWV